MKTIELNCYSIVELSKDEMVKTDGGDFNSGYDAGAAAGKYIRRIIGGVSILKLLFSL
jgi:hypothetical protein